MNFVVYIIMYSGNLLPKWYIGSSTETRINKGYRGSISSVKYKNIWKKELKDNPHLFKIRILSRHNTKQEAIDEEYRLHNLHKVIKNKSYVNMSYAGRKGFEGGDTSIYIDYSKVSKSLSGISTWNKGLKGVSNFTGQEFKGKTHKESSKRQIGEKNRIHQTGTKNSQYGKCWCVKETDVNLNDRKTFDIDCIPDGWITTKEWSKQRKSTTNPSYGKHWYNDGVDNFFMFESQATHLTRGRLKK